MTRFTLLAALSVAALSAACSDGANGEKGLVRFSFVGHYADGADEHTPIATNATLRILLQHPQDGVLVPLDGPTFVQLHLEVKATEGGDDAQVFPTGFAEYGIFFTKAGKYRLSAMQGETELDGLALEVQDPDKLVFSERVFVATRGEKCSTVDEKTLTGLDLAANQSVELYAVPQHAGKPLMGLPALTADATNAALTTTPSSYVLTALGLDVKPTDIGKDAVVTATDLGNNLTAKATIKTHTGDVPVSCQ